MEKYGIRILKIGLQIITVLLVAMSGYLLFGNGVEESLALWLVVSWCLCRASKSRMKKFDVPMLIVSIYIPLVFLGGQIAWEEKVVAVWQGVSIMVGGPWGAISC